MTSYQTTSSILEEVTWFLTSDFVKDEALSYFCDKSMKSCNNHNGFFNHPDDSSYGASPDGLVAPGILLEIKTRAANSDGPLLIIAKNPGYYIQA